MKVDSFLVVIAGKSGVASFVLPHMTCHVCFSYSGLHALFEVQRIV